MKIIDAINAIDALKPNTYTQSEKIAWLSSLDGIIQKQIIDTHESNHKHEHDRHHHRFNGYNDDPPLDTELLAYSPYEDMYIIWLESKIDYHNGEYARYNNSVLNFKDKYNEFQSDYNRTHMPKGTRFKF